MDPKNIESLAHVANLMGWEFSFTFNPPEHIDATVFGSPSKTYLSGEASWTIQAMKPDGEVRGSKVVQSRLDEELAFWAQEMLGERE